MQKLSAAASAVQAAHSRLQANPLPDALIQRLGAIPPLQGVRVPEGSQHHEQLSLSLQYNEQAHGHQQFNPKAPNDHRINAPPILASQEHDIQIHSTCTTTPAPAPDPILIPLICRVASVIEFLKTCAPSPDTSACSPMAAAVARLEHALVSASAGCV
jgi:hypothetical protein